MSGADSVATRVKRALVRALGLGVQPEEIADDEVLFGGGMALDSIASLEIVASLEAEFGFQIPDEDLRPELLDSVATLTEYVEGRLSAATEAEGRGEGPGAGPGI